MPVHVELNQSSTQRICYSLCGKGSPVRMEPSVIFLQRFALKWAILKFTLNWELHCAMNRWIMEDRLQMPHSWHNDAVGEFNSMNIWNGKLGWKCAESSAAAAEEKKKSGFLSKRVSPRGTGASVFDAVHSLKYFLFTAVSNTCYLC